MALSCLSSGVVLVTLALFVCQGQGQNGTQDCNTNAIPQGICGESLDSAYTNLCFLLAQAYPEVYNSSSVRQGVAGQGHTRARREADDELLERIYNIPLPVLAQMDIDENNWRRILQSKDSNIDLEERTEEIDTDPKDTKELPTVPMSVLLEALTKRSPSTRQKRSVPVGLVCKCCINTCAMSHLAIYC